MVHRQVLVIRPKDISLDEVMYPYPEVDKSQGGRMADDRCQFILDIPEKHISSFLVDMENYLKEKLTEGLEKIQYRTKHSCQEYEEKYGNKINEHMLELYIYKLKILNEYEQVKDLDCTDPKQIQFIKDYASFCIEKCYPRVYIEGVGYGHFDNPYNIWDYYTLVNERVFSKDTTFLISNAGKDDNELFLNELDVNSTVSNINNLTCNFEYIIFCEDTPEDSKLYTNDTIKFNYYYNNHCLVEDLKEVLQNIQNKYSEKDYLVTALDFHW